MIKFLFLDNWSFEAVKNYRKILHQPVKSPHNPLLSPEKKWERLRVHLMGSVIFDSKDQLFKMWYLAGGPLPEELKEIWNLCHAVSQEGFHWDRPELEVLPFEGKASNILVERAMGASVLLDELATDPAGRYKMISSRGTWIKGWFSPDGLHWQLVKEPGVINTYSDTHHGLWRDPDSGLYVITHRLEGSRRVWRSESGDFLNWTRPILALEPDVNDPPQTQFNAMPAFPYGHLTMGLLQILRTREEDKRWEKYDGTLTVELTHSRHGGGWHRTMRGQDFISLGLPNAWDAGMIQPASAPVFLKDEIRFYYSGTPYEHGGDKTKGDPNSRRPYYLSGKECIGTAGLRIDGFVSLKAGEIPGELLTLPFALRTPEIFLNFRTESGGSVCLEVQEEQGMPISGFSMADCIPTAGDSTGHPVRWRNNPDLSRIVGKPIRLKMIAYRAEIFSVWMSNGDPDPQYWRFHEPLFLNPLKDLEISGS
jgi:hypothetical protein